MGRIISVAFIVLLGSGCSGERKGAPVAAKDASEQQTKVERDDDLLQGTWRMLSFEKDGEKMPDASKGRVVIKGTELSLGEEDQVGAAFTFKLLAQENPKGIDLLIPAEPKAPTLGIYKLENDSLTLCVRGRGGRKKDGTPLDPVELTRPGTFSSEDGNMLLVLTRKKM